MATFSVNSSVTSHSVRGSWVRIAALRRELRDLRRLAHQDLVFLEAGVGTDNATERLTKFLEKQRADFVLGAGMAGALSPHLGVGDLVIVERVVGPSTLLTLPQLCSTRQAGADSMGRHSHGNSRNDERIHLQGQPEAIAGSGFR